MLASDAGRADREAKLITAHFYTDQILPKAGALAQTIKAGGKSILALHEPQF